MADKTVGENIRRYREARGMLQKELAERIGKRAGTISNWELGLRDPGADNLKKIAQALEISPSELIGHNDDIKQDSTFEIIMPDDSMFPDIKAGDVLKVSKAIPPMTGDIVVAEVDHKAIVRSLAYIGSSSILLPSDRQSDSVSDFQIIGKVISATRSF